MTKRHFCAIIILAFAGVAHLVERDLAKVEVASSSLVARSKKEHPIRQDGVFFFGMCRSTGELAASTCAKRVKSRGEAGFLRMASAIRGMPGSEFEPRRPLQNTTLWVVFFCVRLGAHRRVSRLTEAVAADSRDTSSKAPRFIRRRRRFGAFLVARSKKKHHPSGWFFFLEQHFCYAKVGACGRVIEREWGNPSKVPPSHSPFLAVGGSADNKTCGQSQKEYPIR